ncbi:MAG: hypothetical protein ABIN23_07500, partial [candidate division WOR-3 bacterium]
MQRREYKEIKELKADITYRLEILERKLLSLETRLSDIENSIRKSRSKVIESEEKSRSYEESFLYSQALRDYTLGE